MPFEVGVFVAAGCLAAAPWRRWSWRAEHLALGLLALQAIGYARLESTTEGWQTSTVAALFALALALGVSAADCVAIAIKGRVPHSQLDIQPSDDSGGSSGKRREPVPRLVAPLAVILALSAYHYWVVGIPILTGQAELARWSISDSGLLGLPGRAVVIGVPLLMASLAALRAQGVRWPRARAARGAVFGTLTGCLLLSGFRGLIATTVVVVVAAYLLRAEGIRPRATSMLRGLALAAVGLGSVAAMSGLYQSYRQVENPAALVWDRLTVGAVEAGDVLLSTRDSGLGAGVDSAMGNDFRYYAVQYGLLSPRTGHYETSAYVSSIMTGRRLGGSLFVVPVNTTALALLIFDLGLGGALATGFIAGAVLRAVGGMVAHGSVYTMPIFVGFYSGILLFVVRGNLPYHLVNWTAMGVLIWAAMSFTRIRVATVRTDA